MTFDPSKPVQTRDGRKARIVCTDQKHEGGGSILALIAREHGDTEDSFSYLPDGRWWANNSDTSLDLINIPETHEVVIYQHEFIGGGLYWSGTNTHGNATASKLVSFTEGEFD